MVLKKSKMGGMFKSDVDQCTVKLLPCSTNATFEKQPSLLGAKLTVEVAVHRACNKKQMENAIVKKPGISQLIPAYVKPAAKKIQSAAPQ